MTPLSQVNGGMLEVILVQTPAESALLSENAKKSHLENSTFGLFLQITLLCGWFIKGLIVVKYLQLLFAFTFGLFLFDIEVDCFHEWIRFVRIRPFHFWMTFVVIVNQLG